jgi:hypothetical protein
MNDLIGDVFTIESLGTSSGVSLEESHYKVPWWCLQIVEKRRKVPTKEQLLEYIEDLGFLGYEDHYFEAITELVKKHG